MTKINKLGKSTFAIAILSFILVAVLAFGGTYAYFSAVAGEAAGVIKMGHLDLSATGEAVTQIGNMTVANNTISQPGQRLVGDAAEDGNGADVSVKVNYNIDYYIRVRFDVKVTPGAYTWDGSKWEWAAAPTKEHDGILTEDNLLTPDADEEANDDDPGEGDNVADHISILDIALKVKEGAAAGDPDPFVTSGEGANAQSWTEYTYTKTGEQIETHTGYFYPASVAAARKEYPTSPANGAGVPITSEYQMDVLINIQDWVGAHGCTYYMDAGIEVRFQVEILQADFLDCTKLTIDTKGDGDTFTDFTGEVDADTDNRIPGTIRELHHAWNAAIGLSQQTV